MQADKAGACRSQEEILRCRRTADAFGGKNVNFSITDIVLAKESYEWKVRELRQSYGTAVADRRAERKANLAAHLAADFLPMITRLIKR